jgi:propanediol dehydratase small subunit
MGAAFIVLAILLFLFVASSTYRLPTLFRERGCMGREWRRRFPKASKQSIRQFLEVFINAFDLPRRHKLRFSPSDKVMDVYGALYPLRGLPDALEVETFVEEVRRRYGVDLSHSASEDTTLGEIFAATRAS